MFDTSKIALCYPNYTERTDCVLAGGSWLTSLPVTNMKNRIIKKRARSVDLELTSTQFSATWSRASPVLSLALAGHNLSVDALVRIKVYEDETQIALYYDSGWVDVWPSIYQSTDLEWEFDNFWLGRLDEEQRQDFTPLFVHFFESDIVPIAKYLTVEISDQNNSDGYVEIGRLFFADVWQPTRNASLGLSFKHNTNTEIETTLDDTEYFDVKRVRRSVALTLDRIPTEDAFGRVFSIQRLLGIHGEILFAYTTAEETYSYERRFLGRLSELDPIAEPYVDRKHQVPVNITELI